MATVCRLARPEYMDPRVDLFHKYLAEILHVFLEILRYAQ